MREPSVEKMLAVEAAYPVPGIRIAYKRLDKPVKRPGWNKDTHPYRQIDGVVRNDLYPAFANLKTSVALMPRPLTREKLYTNLHERGHLRLKHFGLHWTRSEFKRKKYTRKHELAGHVEEYQAEIFAHEAMRAHGIAVPRTMTRSAKKYVRDWIDSDHSRGIKIDPVVAKWAGWKEARV